MYLGIDPSFTGTGAVIIDENKKIVLSRLISSDPTKNWRDQVRRILDLGVRLWSVIENVDEKLYMCMEGYSYGSVPRAHMMGELGQQYRQVLLDAEEAFHHKAIIVPPTTLKKFVTGSGKASKISVCTTLAEEYGSIYDNDNCYDALGLAQIALAVYQLNHPDRQSGFSKAQMDCIRRYAEEKGFGS